jgi:hypothetical protein
MFSFLKVLVPAIASVLFSTTVQIELGVGPVVTGLLDLVVLVAVHYHLNKKAEAADPVVEFAVPAKRVEIELACSDGKTRWLEITGVHQDYIAIETPRKTFVLEVSAIVGKSCRLVEVA